MKNINRPTGDNTGGIEVFYYTPVENVLRIPTAQDNIISTDIEMVPGGVWYAFYCTRETLAFREPVDPDRKGDRYKPELKGSIAKDSPELAASLRYLRGRKLLVIYKDYNGYYKLVGTKQYFLTFESDLDTSSSNSGANKVGFRFRGEAAKESSFYYGSFTVSQIGQISLSPPDETTTPPDQTGSGSWGQIIGNLVNQEDLVAYIGTRLTDFWTATKGAAQTFGAKITFSVAPRFNSANANQYLKTDANNDLTSISQIPLADVDGLSLALSGKENMGIAQSLVTALEASLKGGVGVDGNTLAKLRALISTLATSDSNQAAQISALQALVQSNDLTLDTVQELVDYIKNNKNLIDSITTSKLNKSVYDAFLVQYASDLSGKENIGIAQALVTALETSLKGGVAVDGNTLAKLRALISTLQAADTTQASQISALQATDTTHTAQISALQALVQSNDLTLDTVQELVDYIKANKSLIDSITTNKLNKSVYDAFLVQYAADLGLKADLVNGKVPASQLPTVPATQTAGITAYNAVNTAYAIGDQVLASSRIWAARVAIAANTANSAPPTDSAVTQNTYWNELSGTHLQNSDTAGKTSTGVVVSFDTIKSGLDDSVTKSTEQTLTAKKTLGPTLVAVANNDVLSPLVISPTFTPGAFTGVTGRALDINVPDTSFNVGGIRIARAVTQTGNLAPMLLLTESGSVAGDAYSLQIVKTTGNSLTSAAIRISHTTGKAILITATGTPNASIEASGSSYAARLTGTFCTVEAINNTSGLGLQLLSNISTNNNLDMLEIYRNTRVSAGSSSSIIFRSQSDVGSVTPVYARIKTIMVSVTDTAQAGALTFETVSAGTTAERMRLDSTGQLVVGYAANGSARLHVRGVSASTGNALLIENSAATNLLTIANTGLVTMGGTVPDQALTTQAAFNYQPSIAAPTAVSATSLGMWLKPSFALMSGGSMTASGVRIDPTFGTGYVATRILELASAGSVKSYIDSSGNFIHTSSLTISGSGSNNSMSYGNNSSTLYHYFDLSSNVNAKWYARFGGNDNFSLGPNVMSCGRFGAAESTAYVIQGSQPLGGQNGRAVIVAGGSTTGLTVTAGNLQLQPGISSASLNLDTNTFAGAIVFRSAEHLTPGNLVETARIHNNNFVIGYATAQPSAKLQVRGGSSSTGNALLIENSAGTSLLQVTNAKNIGLFGSSFQEMVGGLFIGNATTEPITAPAGGGLFYVWNGALKYLGSSGTATTIAAA